MAKAKVLNDADYTLIGRRYGSDEIASEGRRARGVWERDVVQLAPHGYGAAKLAAFKELLSEHNQERESRPEAVAAKRATVRLREEATGVGRSWVNQTTSLLETVAVNDASVAEKLNAALPADDSQLDASIRPLASLLQEQSQQFDADADVATHIAQAEEVAAQLRSSTAAVDTATSAKVADTAAIDRLDGRVYIVIRDLNRAGRRAIRAGKLNAAPADYRFEFTRKSSPQPSPPAATS